MTRLHDFADPDEVETAFYEAFEAANLEAMMELWADDETVTCVHPGGKRLVGLDEIRESWQQIFQSSMRLRFRITERRSLTDESIAVHSVEEEIEISGQEGVRAIVATTNIYVLTDTGWRIWMHHASNTSGDDEEVDEPEEKPTLH